MSNTKKKILMIDDELVSFQNFAFSLEDFEIIHERDFLLGERKLREELFDLVLLDLDLENSGNYKKGLTNIKIIKKSFPNLPIIILTNDKNQETAVLAMEYGADFFFWKHDFNIKKWTTRIKKYTDEKYLKDKLVKIEAEKIYLEKKLHKVELAEAHPFVGRSPQIQEIKEDLGMIAYEFPNAMVLFTGETGVGKEVAAHYFYAHSRRNQHEFVPVNLTAIPESLFESTLFGHTKGAFTGSTEGRIGYFELANEGILFLDEIGEISIDQQKKLLRVLNDKKIRKVGTNELIKLDVQIITATNKDLKKGIIDKTFKADFYHRIAEISIHIPPLRERKEDIMPIIAHYLNVPQRLVEKNFFNKTARQKIMDYSWSGNIRELCSVLKQMQYLQKKKKREQFDEYCLPDEVLNFDLGKRIEQEVAKDILELEKDDSLSRDEKNVLRDLNEIEKFFVEYKKKGIVAEKMGLKKKNGDVDTDALRYKIRTLFKKHPNLVKNRFFKIKEAYTQIPKT